MDRKRVAKTVPRAGHWAVTLLVLAMAIGSLVSGNDSGVTVFLFAIAGVNLLILLVENRRESRSAAR
ncbi:hypothetical protein EON79_18715 [bacterium]|nr:MAG: hypothetical protein EON79_18715 [bacterium]